MVELWKALNKQGDLEGKKNAFPGHHSQNIPFYLDL